MDDTHRVKFEARLALIQNQQRISLQIDVVLFTTSLPQNWKSLNKSWQSHGVWERLFRKSWWDHKCIASINTSVHTTCLPYSSHPYFYYFLFCHLFVFVSAASISNTPVSRLFQPQLNCTMWVLLFESAMFLGGYLCQVLHGNRQLMGMIYWLWLSTATCWTLTLQLHSYVVTFLNACRNNI